MKTKRLLFIVVVALQAGFLLAWAGYHEVVRRTSPLVRLRVNPLDLRHSVRGKYFQFSYPIGSVRAPAETTWTFGDEVWVGLDRDGEFWEAQGIAKQRDVIASAHEFAVRGRMMAAGRDVPVNVDYGIEEYYVPEGTAPPDRQKVLTVEATVSPDGRLNVKRALLDGQSWP